MKIIVILILGVISTLVFDKLLSRNTKSPVFELGFYSSFSIPFLVIPCTFFGLMPETEIYKTISFLAFILAYGCLASFYYTIVHFIAYKKEKKKNKENSFFNKFKKIFN